MANLPRGGWWLAGTGSPCFNETGDPDSFDFSLYLRLTTLVSGFSFSKERKKKRKKTRENGGLFIIPFFSTIPIPLLSSFNGTLPCQQQISAVHLRKRSLQSFSWRSWFPLCRLVFFSSFLLLWGGGPFLCWISWFYGFLSFFLFFSCLFEADGCNWKKFGVLCLFLNS